MTDTDSKPQLTRPNWAEDYDTPYFVVHEKTDDYELREYEETKWALTDMNSNGAWENRSDTSKSFFRLFKYITGNNVGSKKIPMTVPVRMEHTPKHVDMAFMVPHDIQADTPEPNAEQVRIVSVPRQMVYVKTFGGWPKGFFGNKNYWETNLAELRAALDRDGKKYVPEKFYTAGYDSPWKLFNRHNEVWVSKDES